MSTKGGSLSRADVIWILQEVLQADAQIKAGNKDRYVIGRSVALHSAGSRLLKVGRKDFERYIAWLALEVESGKRIGALPEPIAWTRENPE